MGAKRSQVVHNPPPKLIQVPRIIEHHEEEHYFETETSTLTTEERDFPVVQIPRHSIIALPNKLPEPKKSFFNWDAVKPDFSKIKFFQKEDPKPVKVEEKSPLPVTPNHGLKIDEEEVKKISARLGGITSKGETKDAVVPVPPKVEMKPHNFWWNGPSTSRAGPPEPPTHRKTSHPENVRKPEGKPEILSSSDRPGRPELPPKPVSEMKLMFQKPGSVSPLPKPLCIPPKPATLAKPLHLKPNTPLISPTYLAPGRPAINPKPKIGIGNGVANRGSQKIAMNRRSMKRPSPPKKPLIPAKPFLKAIDQPSMQNELAERLAKQRMRLKE